MAQDIGDFIALCGEKLDEVQDVINNMTSDTEEQLNDIKNTINEYMQNLQNTTDELRDLIETVQNFIISNKK